MIKLSYFTKKQNRGTQPKWEKDNIWYKADDIGYEGMSESIVSDMLKKSNINNYAEYSPVLIRWRHKLYSGCQSENFLHGNEVLLEGNDILKSRNENWNSFNSRFGTDIEGKMREYIKYVKEDTGLDTTISFCKMMEMDLLTLNADRNGGNIAYIQEVEGKSRPILFDYGRALLTYNIKGSREPDIKKWILEYTPKILFDISGTNFSDEGQKQETAAAERAAGGRRHLLLHYTRKDLEETLAKCSEIYPKEIVDIYRKIVLCQMERYPQYFYDKRRVKEAEEFAKLVQKETGGRFSYTIDDCGYAFLTSKADPDFQCVYDAFDKSIQFRYKHIPFDIITDVLFEASSVEKESAYKAYRNIASERPDLCRKTASKNYVPSAPQKSLDDAVAAAEEKQRIGKDKAKGIGISER